MEGIHATAHLGAGDIHLKAVLAQVIHMGHQKLDHHVRAGDQKHLYVSSLRIRWAIWSLFRPYWRRRWLWSPTAVQ